MVKHSLFPLPSYHRRYDRGDVVSRPICVADVEGFA